MKTSIDIPSEVLQEVMEHTGAKTKREAVVTAIEEFNRRRRSTHLAERLGTFRDFMTRDDLQRLREES